MDTKILIGIPWDISHISTTFSIALRNIGIPYKNKCIVINQRSDAERRNAICQYAVTNDFSHVMTIDADQVAPEDSFIRLWNILEKYGHENTVAFGWAICGKGQFNGKPSIFERTEQGFKSIGIQTIENYRRPFEVESSGSPCVLFSTKVLEKLGRPFFAELYIIRQHDNPDGEWLFTDYVTGSDFVFSARAKMAGVKLVCDPQLKLRHEKMITV